MGSQRSSIGTYVGPNFISSSWYAKAAQPAPDLDQLGEQWRSRLRRRTWGAPERSTLQCKQSRVRGNHHQPQTGKAASLYMDRWHVNGSDQEHTNGLSRERIPDRELRVRPSAECRNQPPPGEQRRRESQVRQRTGLATHAGMLLQSMQNNFLYRNTFRDGQNGVQALAMWRRTRIAVTGISTRSSSMRELRQQLVRLQRHLSRRQLLVESERRRAVRRRHLYPGREHQRSIC